MARKRKYKNAAEKQKAFRLRHGQKVKVPVEIRRGEKLGSQETDLRAKKEGETWEQYQAYIKTTIDKARHRQAGQVVAQKGTGDEEDSKGAKRSAGGYKEPSVGAEIYEIQYQHEQSLKKLGVGRKARKRRTAK